MIPTISAAVEGEIELRATQPPNHRRYFQQLFQLRTAILVQKRPREIERYNIIDQPRVREGNTRM